jgi:hypothetical protein
VAGGDLEEIERIIDRFSRAWRLGLDAETRGAEEEAEKTAEKIKTCQRGDSGDSGASQRDIRSQSKADQARNLCSDAESMSCGWVSGEKRTKNRVAGRRRIHALERDARRGSRERGGKILPILSGRT